MNLLDLAIRITAKDEASDKIEGITANALTKATVIGNAIYDVGKAVVTKGADMVMSIGEGAIEGYGKYEQLVGGMDKLFGESSDKIQKYAQDAWKTSGVSANEYMEQTTSFSAALIKSLGGDTEKAADYADMAIRAMSDNANTFGTDMGSIQNAFQGFAKENYTMLDNLSLGYAGTKEGAQQLVAEAAKMTDVQEKLGITVDENSLSFDNMVAAIAVVQENMGIAGTTAKEAMGTIEGSVNAAKASWQNLLVAIGSGDSELLRQSVSGLVDSIFGTFNEETQKREGGVIQNVIPVIQNVATAIIEEFPNIASTMASQFIALLADALGIDSAELEGKLTEIWENVGATIQSLMSHVQAIADAVFSFFSEHGEQLMEIVGTIGETVATVIDTAMALIEELMPVLKPIADFLLDMLLTAVRSISDVITALKPILEAIGKAVLPVIQAALTFLKPILEGLVSVVGWLVEVLTGIINFVGPAIEAVLNGIGAVAKVLAGDFEGAAKLIEGAWEGVKTFFGTLGDFFAGVGDAIANVWKGVTDAVGRMFEQFVANIGSFAEGIGKGVQSIIDWFARIPENVANVFRNAGQWLVNAGRNIIQGFFNGLREKWEGLKSWFGGIGSWIQQHKGPEQYDRNLLVRNGGWIMEGLGKGLEDAFAGDVIPLVSGMGGRMGSAFGSPVLSAGVSASGQAAIGAAQVSGRDLTVILELDRMQLGHAVYRLNNEETQRVGVQLAGGYA